MKGPRFLFQWVNLKHWVSNFGYPIGVPIWVLQKTSFIISDQMYKQLKLQNISWVQR